MAKNPLSPGFSPDLHPDSFRYARISRVAEETAENQTDVLATEEPLEIRLGFGPEKGRWEESIAVTMRTPGQDLELAAGFLLTEGVICRIQDLRSVRHCPDVKKPEEQTNVVRADLAPNLKVDLKRLKRHIYTSSSCGVCGKTSIEAIRSPSCPTLPPAVPMVSAAVVHRLPHLLRQEQALFAHTGGLHAAALFDAAGELVLLREDVGRHNALDKLIGAALFLGLLPLHQHLLLVSGRASFELVQKAVLAGVPVMAAVGAPSSLAVETASGFGMTLLGFVRDQGFNIYTGPERVVMG